MTIFHRKVPSDYFILGLILLIMEFFNLARDDVALQLNLAGLALIKGRYYEAFVALEDLPSHGYCQANWLLGWSLKGEARYIAWSKFLKCTNSSVSMVKVLLPADQNLARIAIQIYPNNKHAWLWLADITKKTDLQSALTYYMTSTSLYYPDGYSWCQVGEANELLGLFEKALTAYAKCCTYNDVGFQGCFGAGRMAEKLGDPQKAIEYYSMSHWEGSLKRADELEAQLNSGK